jgi:very-short-patch-repair endonuclease
MLKKFINEQEKEICRQYNEDKLSTVVLAKRWGCVNTTIGDIIRRNGFSLRSANEANKGQKAWNKDIPCSDETKRKISIGNKGQKAWNKDLTKETDERVKKISESQKGKPKSEELRKKFSESHKNIPHSEERKRKIGDALRDRPLSEEHKRNIGISNKGKIRSEESRKNLSKSHEGKTNGPLSEETKNKLREKALFRVQNHSGPYKNTKPELKMKEILTELNIPFEHQFRLRNHLFDFHILNTNILIEVDGDYFHGNPKKFNKLSKIQKQWKQKDIEINEVAIENNYILLRFWESDILKNTEEVKEELARL